MPERQPNDHLHLPDLLIQGFRGIKNLSITKLGRVTLLTGKNSIGKTTVLEAVAVFATRGLYSALENLLARHDELSTTQDEDGDGLQTPDIDALFHGRFTSGNAPIVIGSSDATNQLKIEKASLGILTEEQTDLIGRYVPELYGGDDFRVFKISFQGQEYFLPRFDIVKGTGGTNFIHRRLRRNMRSFLAELNSPEEIRCETLDSGLLDNNEIVRLWEKIALTGYEEWIVEILKLGIKEKVDRVAVIGGTENTFIQDDRRVIVRLKGHNNPVPLKSLGDGAVRLLSVALALANSQYGILLIDEAENSIHRSLHQEYWRMILRTAHENNTQVLATTQSRDCIRGFAQATLDAGNDEYTLIRLERDGEDVQEIPYSEDELKIAAE